MTDKTQKHCKTCGGKVLAERPGTNHLVHIIMSIITAGLWLPIWLLSAVKIGGWRCTRCGSRV